MKGWKLLIRMEAPKMLKKKQKEVDGNMRYTTCFIMFLSYCIYIQ